MKSAVDDAIDKCAEVFNLRDAIEEARIRAEQSTDERQRRLHAQKGTCTFKVFTLRLLMFHSGLQNLRRYFELIIFQAYLQSIEPDTMQSFETIESFVRNRPGMCTACRSNTCGLWLTDL